ncbi:MAG: hypothetical protein AAF927_23365 [Bacteroidota bacterium]
MASLKPYFPLSIGLVLRLLYGLWLGPDLFANDAIYYVEEAQLLLESGQTSLYWPPALIYLLAGWGWFWGLSWGSCMVFMLLWYIAFDVLLRKADHGLWPSYLFALYPVFIHHSVSPLTQLPVAVCLMAVYLLGRRKASGWLSGLLLGLGVLLRAGTASVLPAVLLRRTPSQMLSIGLGLILVVGAWLGIAAAQNDKFVPVNTANAYNFYLGNNPWTPDYKSYWLGSHDESQNPAFAGFYAERDSIFALAPSAEGQAFRDLAVKYIKSEPTRFVYRLWQRFKLFWAFDTFTAATVQERSPALAWGIQLWEMICYGLIWGWLFLGWWNQSAQNFAPLLWPICYMLPYLLAFSHPTYHLPLLPLMVLMLPRFAGRESLRLLPKKITWRQTIWGLCLLFWCYIQIEWAWSLLS